MNLFYITTMAKSFDEAWRKGVIKRLIFLSDAVIPESSGNFDLESNIGEKQVCLATTDEHITRPDTLFELVRKMLNCKAKILIVYCPRPILLHGKQCNSTRFIIDEKYIPRMTKRGISCTAEDLPLRIYIQGNFLDTIKIALSKIGDTTLLNSH
jgi:hypothetical protein